MGQGSGTGHRLTCAERLELQRRVRFGETHQSAAAAVGCSAKSVQRLLVKTGGLMPRVTPQSALRLSCSEREEIFARPTCWRVLPPHRCSARPVAIDRISRSRGRGSSRSVPGLAG